VSGTRRRKRRMPTWAHGPVYAGIRAAIGATGILDIADASRSARSLARLYASIEKKRFQRTMDTLGVAFPDMPMDQRRAHAELAYEHLFQLGVEMMYTSRLITPDGWSSRVSVSTLGPSVRHLVEQRPCVLITGHCGNWELLGYTLALIGFPMYALYRPLDLKPLDAWVRRTREARGLVLLDKFGAARVMPRLMKENGLIGFIADQNAGDRGLFVPFFNRLASTYKSIGLIAIQNDAPVICGQARRLSERERLSGAGDGPAGLGGRDDPFRYQVDVIDIILPEDWKGQPDPLFYVSARYRRALEQMVRRAPEQNLWLHRYWKSRPRHEQLGRPFPPALRDKIRALPWVTGEDLARIEDWSARDTADLTRV
jgi:Kdo2-lipid IVA lauroyltransferase/acyltransferase